VAQIGTVLSLLAFLSWGCNRAGEEADAGSEGNRSGVEAESGFVVGQVSTGPGPQSSQPIEGIEHAEVGRMLRRAIRDLPMFYDEGYTGPRIDFVVRWSIGIGTEEPPPSEGSGASAADAPYAIMVMSVRGESEASRNQFEVQGIYRSLIPPGEAPITTGWRLIAEAIDDLAQGIFFETEPRTATSTRVVELIGDSDIDRALPAIREAHRRRLQSAARALRGLVDSNELELAIGAVTALGQLGDPEAVRPLIDLISRERRELTELVLPVLGQIGTVEARRYLEMVASAHEAESIRQLASDVLQQVRP
jgi:hypothetical protein